MFNEYSYFGSVIIITNGTLVLMIFFLWSGDLGHFSDQVKLVEKCLSSYLTTRGSKVCFLAIRLVYL